MGLNGRFRSALAITLAVGLTVSRSSGQTATWSKISGPYASGITLLAVDRLGTVFAATQMRGMFRSTDAGETWQASNTGLSWPYLSTFVVDSSDNIYTGSNLSPGFYRSTDEGASWTKTNLPGGAQTALVISGNRLCVGGTRTVSISGDGGNTWSSSNVVTVSATVLSVAEDGFGDLYAGLQAYFPKDRPPWGGGVYVSKDSGRTWEAGGLDLTSILSMARGKNGRMFVLVPSGILSAAPGDTNWAREVLGLPPTGIVSMFADPQGDLVAATPSGFYEYDIAGSRWVRATPGLMSATLTAAYYDANGTCYLGTSRDGIFSLGHNSSDWEQCGISPASIASLGLDPSGILYAGTDDGIYRKGSTDWKWIRCSDGLNSGYVYRIVTSAYRGRTYAATSGGAFYSSDTGGSWRLVYPAWTYDVLDLGQGRMYAGTTGGVVVSSDGGVSWARTQSVAMPAADIYSLAGQDPSSIYAATRFAGVFMTTDNGNFWNEMGLTSPLMFASVKSLEIDGTGRIFAGTDSMGAFYSDDGGTGWHQIGSLDSTSVSTLLVNHPGCYLAGTLDRGVFLSADGGLTWNPLNTGLGDTSVSSLAIDRNGYLFAGTTGGLYRTDDVVTGVHDRGSAPADYELSQNYPNPFNPVTAIRYQLSGVSDVSLTVYDVLGREVETLVNSRLTAGTHTVMFDGSRLASGIYFYRIAIRPQTGSSILETKKMVLVK